MLDFGLKWFDLKWKQPRRFRLLRDAPGLGLQNPQPPKMPDYVENAQRYFKRNVKTDCSKMLWHTLLTYAPGGRHHKPNRDVFKQHLGALLIGLADLARREADIPPLRKKLSPGKGPHFQGLSAQMLESPGGARDALDEALAMADLRLQQRGDWADPAALRELMPAGVKQSDPTKLNKDEWETLGEPRERGNSPYRPGEPGPSPWQPSRRAARDGQDSDGRPHPWPYDPSRWSDDHPVSEADCLAFYAPLHYSDVSHWGIWILVPQLLDHSRRVSTALGCDEATAARLVLELACRHELYHHLEECVLTELERRLGSSPLYNWYIETSPMTNFGPPPSQTSHQRSPVMNFDPLSEALATAYALRSLDAAVVGVPDALKRRFIHAEWAATAHYRPGYSSARNFASDNDFRAGERLLCRRCVMPRVGPWSDDTILANPSSGGREHTCEIVGSGWSPADWGAGYRQVPVRLWGPPAARDHLHALLPGLPNIAWEAVMCTQSNGPTQLIDVWEGEYLEPNRVEGKYAYSDSSNYNLEEYEAVNGRVVQVPGVTPAGRFLGQDKIREPYLLVNTTPPIPYLLSPCGRANGWANGCIRVGNDGVPVCTDLASVTDIVVHGEGADAVAYAIGLAGAVVAVSTKGTITRLRGPCTVSDPALHALTLSAGEIVTSAGNLPLPTLAAD